MCFMCVVMSTPVTLCVFRIEICKGSPTLNHINFTTSKFLLAMDSGERTVNDIASSSKEIPLLTRKVRGCRQMQDITIETYENHSQKEMEGDESLDTQVIDSPVRNNCDQNTVSSNESLSKLKGNDIAQKFESEPNDHPSGEINKQRIPESVGFISGNPFVEITKGILHLYKENKSTSMENGVDRSEMICMLAVPASVTCHDLLCFVAACERDILHLRIIRDSTPNQYMALIKFRSQDTADAFYKTFNGIPFNSMEPNVCSLAFVSRVEMVREDAGESVLWPPPNHTELPTCPVCLERMDESVDGILTILCNHSFHGSCLSKWGDYT
ncbi:hypothetical protein J437_LFUL011508, partial [Ladona fulva]